MPFHHRRGGTHPPLLDWLHARRRRVPPVLRLPQPIRLLHAGPGARRQPAPHFPGVGRGRCLLLPADLVLVHRRGQRHSGQEGVRDEPDRRLGIHGRHLPYLLHVWVDRLRGRPGHHGGRHGSYLDSDGHCRDALRGGHRQVGPVPALPVAARRYGRSDTRLSTDPRRHHGHLGHLPAHPGQPDHRRRRRLGPHPDRLDGGRDGAVRGDHRRRPARHQKGAGLLHHQPVGLHVPSRGLWGIRGCRVPHGHPRLLQGPPLPGVWFGHPRDER